MHHEKTSNWNYIAKYAVLSLADIGVLFALLWLVLMVGMCVMLFDTIK